MYVPEHAVLARFKSVNTEGGEDCMYVRSCSSFSMQCLNTLYEISQ